MFMFSILSNYKTANNVLLAKINKLKKKGYTILQQKHVLDDLHTIDKITIRSKKKTKQRLVLSSGLHGVEGYVGHAAIHSFLDSLLGTVHNNTEIVIYPTLNPYGMDTHQRTNIHNVDLNRNFSKNDFSSKNNKYLEVKEFVTPTEFKNTITMNSSFYFELGKLMKRNGVKFLNEAFLMGQNYQQNGIYYTGTTYEPETIYIMNQFKSFMKTKTPLVWIDIHSGYGPKDQMSIINSQYEIDVTKQMIEKCDYPLILGINDDDIYDTDGDIIEKLYEIRNDKYSKVDFYATTFEFGTLGLGSVKSIESLKALIARNHVRYIQENANLSDYAVKLMKKQFAPKGEKWRRKADQDFLQAMNEIIKFKKLD